MYYFYLDASVYAKFYYPEPGSDLVIALIEALPGAQARRLIVTSMTVAVLNRRYNELQLSDAQFGLVVPRLLADVSKFTLWRTRDDDLLNAIVPILSHNLNASDGLHLYTALRLDQLLRRAQQSRLVLVAADQRLLHAAAAEGMTTLNPEATTLEEVHHLVAVS
jgi:predicted nucleic acid-binding protein